MAKVRLVDKERKQVADVWVDDLGKAAILLYEGRYFLFSQVEGKFHSKFTFMEVNPPVPVREGVC